MRNILIGSKSFGSSNEAKEKLNSISRNIGHYKLVQAEYNEVEGIIAGTEEYDKDTLQLMPNLKVISRMGVGYDAINLKYCKSHNIKVTYTPYAATKSVAELALAHILTLSRNLHLANLSMHRSGWNKYYGKQLSEISIGVLGTGRIGGLVLYHLSNLGIGQLFACDIKPDIEKVLKYSDVKWLDINELFYNCDLITIHIPLSKKNHHLVDNTLLGIMKKDSMLVNTSRGPIINERDLSQSLTNKTLSGIALDVFEDEPYCGKFTELDNVILSSHMGSMTLEARHRMENESVDDCLRVLDNKKPIYEIPFYEEE